MVRKRVAQWKAPQWQLSFVAGRRRGGVRARECIEARPDHDRSDRVRGRARRGRARSRVVEIDFARTEAPCPRSLSRDAKMRWRDVEAAACRRKMRRTKVRQGVRCPHPLMQRSNVVAGGL